MLDLFRRQEAGEATAGEVFDKTATAAVREVVRRQVEAGITIANDGEQSKTGYADYMRNRITAFVNLPLASIDAMTLVSKIRGIGAMEGSTSKASGAA